MKYEEIYNKLPASWEEVKLSTAIKYLNIQMELPSEDEFENIQIGLNNIYKTIAVLADVSIDEVKQLPIAWINKMATKTAFMNTQPEPKKESNIKWKELDEVTYDNFITFTQLQEDMVNNMPTIIKAFAKTKMTEKEIVDMSMQEAVDAFFLLKKQLNKSIQHMQMSLAKRLMKQASKEIWNKLTHFRQK